MQVDIKLGHSIHIQNETLFSEQECLGEVAHSADTHLLIQKTFMSLPVTSVRSRQSKHGDGLQRLDCAPPIDMA